MLVGWSLSVNGPNARTVQEIARALHPLSSIQSYNKLGSASFMPLHLPPDFTLGKASGME